MVMTRFGKCVELSGHELDLSFDLMVVLLFSLPYLLAKSQSLLRG